MVLTTDTELQSFLIRNKGILLNLLEKALIAENNIQTQITPSMTSDSEKSRSRSRHRSNSVLSTPERHRRFRTVSRTPSRSPSRDRKRERKTHKKSSRRYSRSRSRSRRLSRSPPVFVAGRRIRPESPGRTYSPISRRGSGMPPPPARRYRDGRENPDPCRCIGIFGMSLHTREKDLEKIFGEFGAVEQVQIVRDRVSGRSRGFGFIYFERTKYAARAKEEMSDAVIDGMNVRVDFSVTKKPGGFSGGSSHKERGGHDYSPRRRRGSPVY